MTTTARELPDSGEFGHLKEIGQKISEEDPVGHDLVEDIRDILEARELRDTEITVELSYDSRGKRPKLYYEVRKKHSTEIEFQIAEGYEFTGTDKDIFEEYIWPEIERYFKQDAFSDAAVSTVEVFGESSNLN